MADMNFYIGGQLIPKPSLFKRKHDVNEVNNVTLSGTLYTDFLHIRRAWTISWERLKMSDFETIYSIFESQYTNNEYPVMNFPEYDVLTPVKLEISEQQIRWNGTIVEGFTMTVIEKYAFS